MRAALAECYPIYPAESAPQPDAEATSAEAQHPPFAVHEVPGLPPGAVYLTYTGKDGYEGICRAHAALAADLDASVYFQHTAPIFEREEISGAYGSEPEYVYKEAPGGEAQVFALVVRDGLGHDETYKAALDAVQKNQYPTRTIVWGNEVHTASMVRSMPRPDTLPDVSMIKALLESNLRLPPDSANPESLAPNASENI